MNTYLVYSKVFQNGRQICLTEDRVNRAESKEAAAAKIEARGNHVVTGVIFVSKAD